MNDAAKRWLGGRGPLVVLVVVLTALLASGYGGFGHREAAAAPPAADCKTAKNAKNATPVGKAHFTPGPKTGAVTPLPGATPFPAQPGLKLGMITRPMSLVQTIQKRADQHWKKYAWYTVPVEVVRHTLPQYGFKPPVKVVSPPKPQNRAIGRPVRKAVVEYKNELYSVSVAQPSKHGPHGIWVIVTIVRQHLRVGGIARSLSTVRRTQALVDSGKKKYQFWRNPTDVVRTELPQYGFNPPFKIVKAATSAPSINGQPRSHAVVSYRGSVFDIYLTQPDKRGSHGVWVVTTISPRP